ncbi:MAG: FAD-dependent oxidoreductase [Chloroflexi bacterium]|nr:FAD-dependent oxidoreductase [Chloroflexota bacterium]
MGLNFPSRVGLLKKLAINNVKIHTGHKIVAFLPNGVLAQTQDGKEHTIAGDTTVVAFGMKANNSLVEAVQAKWDDVYVVGDCVSPAKVGEAVRAGWNAGRML